MTHPCNKLERIRLKHLKDEVKASKSSRPSKVWKKGLEALKGWEDQHELEQHIGS